MPKLNEQQKQNIAKARTASRRAILPRAKSRRSSARSTKFATRKNCDSRVIKAKASLDPDRRINPRRSVTCERRNEGVAGETHVETHGSFHPKTTEKIGGLRIRLKRRMQRSVQSTSRCKSTFGYDRFVRSDRNSAVSKKPSEQKARFGAKAEKQRHLGRSFLHMQQLS